MVRSQCKISVCSQEMLVPKAQNTLKESIILIVCSCIRRQLFISSELFIVVTFSLVLFKVVVE